MILTHLTLVALALAGGTADPGARRPRDAVTAIYQPASNRFCVRPHSLGGAEATGLRVHRRQCLTRNQWRTRGIGFQRPARVQAAGA